jgi:hypothetical protein
MEAQLHLMSALAISAGQWLASCPCCYNAHTPQIGGWLDGYLDKRKTPCPWWNKTQIIQPVA